jgi:hypothetical protein
MKSMLSITLFALTVFGCHLETEKYPIAFYHWKTESNIGQKELQFLDSLKCKKIYVRFFDVKWVENQKAAFPFAEFKNSNKQKLEQVIVPVVFITNEALIKTNSNTIVTLAEKISDKLIRLLDSNNISREQVDEFQFDCDWSEKTKDKYFLLLNNIKTKIRSIKEFDKIKTSATIRLHQVKFRDISGVPPVDKGVLMFYNMGEVTKENTVNSILDLKTASNYLVNFDSYPLELDVALPLFSWGVHFRNGKIIQLLNDINIKKLNTCEELKKIDEQHFEVTKSFYLESNYIYKGDKIRIESVTPETLHSSLDVLKKHIKNKNFTVLFYHLNSELIQNYSADKILDLCEK